MIVIADTSPLHYLILLEHADVLAKIAAATSRPQAVGLISPSKEK